MGSRGVQGGGGGTRREKRKRRRRRQRDVTTFIDPTPKSTCKEIHLWEGIDVLAASDLWPRIFSLSIRILLYIANGGRRRGRRWRSRREKLKVEGRRTEGKKEGWKEEGTWTRREGRCRLRAGGAGRG